MCCTKHGTSSQLAPPRRTPAITNLTYEKQIARNGAAHKWWEKEWAVPGQIRTLINDMCEDEEVKVGTQAVVHQPRHSIKKLAVAKLAGRTPTGGGGGGGGMERRLIELATHLHPGLASISSRLIQEGRQWGDSEERKRAGKNGKKG